MKLAALDIETLGLGTRSHVTDIGLVLAYMDTDFKLNYQNGLRIRLDQKEQSSLSRYSNDATLKFQYKTHGEKAFKKHLDSPKDYTIMKSADAFNAIRSACEDAEEIWINGLSFDTAILNTLREETNCEKPLWFFRKERDVRTVRETNSFVFEHTKTLATHDAYLDAKWNIKVARSYHRWTKSKL